MVVFPVPPLPLAIDIFKANFFSFLLPCHLLTALRAVYLNARHPLPMGDRCAAAGADAFAAGAKGATTTPHAPSAALTPAAALSLSGAPATALSLSGAPSAASTGTTSL